MQLAARSFVRGLEIRLKALSHTTTPPIKAKNSVANCNFVKIPSKLPKYPEIP
jgi:hypothetical protein